jgi:hypothetical protein
VLATVSCRRDGWGRQLGRSATGVDIGTVGQRRAVGGQYLRQPCSRARACSGLRRSHGGDVARTRLRRGAHVVTRPAARRRGVLERAATWALAGPSREGCCRDGQHGRRGLRPTQEEMFFLFYFLYLNKGTIAILVPQLLLEAQFHP